MSVLLEGRFAVLGYGSLIWDLDDLAPHVELPWAMGGGPLLPMEFSRISPKRKMGLVVVLDPDNGVPCPTHAIASVKTDIHSVADDLMRRERAKSIEQIGAVVYEHGICSNQDAKRWRSGEGLVRDGWRSRCGMD